MAEADTDQATVADVLAWVDEPASGWETRAAEALAAEEAGDAPRTTLVGNLQRLLAKAGAAHIDGQPAPVASYPDRPYHEAVDPAAFPGGLPPEAVAPTTPEES